MPLKLNKLLPLPSKESEKRVNLFSRKLLPRCIHNLNKMVAKRIGLRNISCHTSPFEARALCVRVSE